MKQIIQSTLLFNNYNILSEGSDSNTGIFMVRGILQRADSENQNGRIYPFKILEREANKYQKVFISEKRAYGELDHPDSSIVSGQSTSHTVEKIWWKGKELWGDLEILDTPSGSIVKNILKAGKTLGISSRGLGSIKQLTETTVEVDDDFELIAFDFVTNPSTQGAFMKRLNEGVNNENINIYNDLHNKINTIIRGL